MNLSEHFEPLHPPKDGLSNVRRRARKRALQKKLVSGGAFLLFPLILVVGFSVTNMGSGDGNVADVASSTTSGIAPDSAGLPGASVSVGVTSNAWIGLVLAVVIIATTVGISWLRLRSSETPIARFSVLGKIFLIIGATAPIWLYFLTN